MNIGNIINSIFEGRAWIFSGIGCLVITAIFSIFKKNKKSTQISQKQKGGIASTNTQIGVQNNYGEKKDE